MPWIIIIILVVLALLGFANTGRYRGWFGDEYRPASASTGGWAGWTGSGIGVVLLILALVILFGQHRY